MNLGFIPLSTAEEINKQLCHDIENTTSYTTAVIIIVFYVRIATLKVYRNLKRRFYNNHLLMSAPSLFPHNIFGNMEIDTTS